MKKIVLRSSWQTKNIGDIAHTPGFLRLAQDYLKDVQIVLWPCQIDRGVREMLLENFPSLQIADTDEQVLEAFKTCDLFVQGSCPNVEVGGINFFRKHSDKPYGLYGVSADGLWTDAKKDVLDHAAFIYCRDSISEHFLKQQGLQCPDIAFTPDATFALRLKGNAESVKAFLKENELEEGKFICVIPRLRWTPASFDDDHFYYKDPVKEQVAMGRIEEDMAKLREVICAIVEKSDLKVLICPEMTYQVPMGKRYLFDRLPEKIKEKVVLKRSYWITDEAQEVYRYAHSLVSMEMHSPIIFSTLGKPAILLRQAEDTVKGQMWRDVGLQDWMLELNVTEESEIEEKVFSVIRDYPAALAKMEKARARAEKIAQERLSTIVKRFL